MYKLVVVGGKLRGKEFILKSGDNTLGRESTCDIHFQVEGVSKKHLTITVTDDILYVQDTGSANGTFLNGKIIKRATVKGGDKIGLPNAILQVVQVQEKKIIIQKKVIHQREREETIDDLLKGGSPPDSLIGKAFWVFKYKFMPFLHGINQEYEWRVLLAIFTALFALSTITLTIFPVLQDSKEILINEIANRGAHYAEEIGRINAVALEQKNLERIDTTFLDNEDGVVSYELFDLEGRIVRPISRLNEYTNDPFSVQTREWATRNKDSKLVKKQLLENGQIGIGKKILAYNSKTGTPEQVGIIAIRFAPRTLAVEATKSSKLYLESLITSLLVAIIFFGIVYYLTLRPIEEFRYQIEEALRGKRRSIESKLLFEELGPVKNAINTGLQRIRELQRDESEMDPNDLEGDESYVNTLVEFMQGAQGPIIVLNSSKNLIKLNPQAEDVCGIRLSMSEGMNILDITKERGFAATLIELCDSSANNGGTSQQGHYELQGKQYNIFTTSLMGKDGFAKGFYISFVLDA
ncbi:MAG: FHA domain-containing protein [Bacteriovorax sp.]|jgi:pSer/pThr/pTyr-binding forkhead associated (FHA) protein/PAS domain-containing protein|nr:FHA domain-containing protein [Bacteriovorax sp.]